MQPNVARCVWKVTRPWNEIGITNKWHDVFVVHWDLLDFAILEFIPLFYSLHEADSITAIQRFIASIQWNKVLIATYCCLLPSLATCYECCQLLGVHPVLLIFLYVLSKYVQQSVLVLCVCMCMPYGGHEQCCAEVLLIYHGVHVQVNNQ